jgi:hypothetical protein
MPKIAYTSVEFKPSTLALVKQCNAIIAEYQAQGFTLTLRQLYYQLVSRDVIPNKQQEYKRLGSIVNDARLAGMIDWNSIEDRTRNLRSIAHWTDPAEIISAVANQFRHDKWATQPYRPEVWIEKDALVGVIEGVCQELDVPFFSCRGYTSQSEMWTAGQRLLKKIEEGRSRAHPAPGRPRPVGDRHDARHRGAAVDVPVSSPQSAHAGRIQADRAEHGPGRAVPAAAESGEAD